MGGLVDLCTAVDPLTLASSRQYSRLNTYDKGRSLKDNDKRLDGTTDYTFSLALVPLLDKAIVDNNLYLLSIDQERFISRYFKEADTEVLSNDTKQLDEFLGSV